MKLKLILMLLLPLLSQAAELIRAKDENSTGLDDEAAEAIDHALKRLQVYLT